jgi:hypothetical protein
VAELDDEALPEEMREMNAEQKQAHIKQQQQRRSELQQQINELQQQRRDFITAKQKEAGKANANTLDTALIEAMRVQASRQNFTLE